MYFCFLSKFLLNVFCTFILSLCFTFLSSQNHSDHYSKLLLQAKIMKKLKSETTKHLYRPAHITSWACDITCTGSQARANQTISSANMAYSSLVYIFMGNHSMHPKCCESCLFAAVMHKDL